MAEIIIKITGLEELAERLAQMSPEQMTAFLKRDTKRDMGVFEQLTRPHIRPEEITLPPKQPASPPYSATYSYGTLSSDRWAKVEDVVATFDIVNVESRCLPPTHVFAPGAAACYCGALSTPPEESHE